MGEDTLLSCEQLRQSVYFVTSATFFELLRTVLPIDAIASSVFLACASVFREVVSQVPVCLQKLSRRRVETRACASTLFVARSRLQKMRTCSRVQSTQSAMCASSDGSSRNACETVRVYRQKPNVVIPLLQRTYKTNQERGNRGDAERSVVSASVLSISAKWTKELNKRDETVMRSSAHQKRGPATTQILNYLTTTKQRNVIEQKNLKATLMRRAPDNMRRTQESVCCSKNLRSDRKVIEIVPERKLSWSEFLRKATSCLASGRQFGRGELDQGHRVDELVSCWILQL